MEAQTRTSLEMNNESRRPPQTLSILISIPTPYRHLTTRKALSIYLTSKSMQRNKLLRLEAKIGNSENSDSESTDSEITLKANPETDPQYCKSFKFLFIPV
jgi:hypothetical protein